jgi:hypothetical protein
MILGTGYGTDVILILLGLLIVLFFLQFKSIIMFKILAKINKVILPSLYKKDITKLKYYEKVILGYRYWVTRNSL